MIIHITSPRPGQLGDTGIIVLQHCGPLKKKGCECDAEQEKETKAQSQVSYHKTFWKL